MNLQAPEVDIAVDRDTGIWQTDDMPMIYLPRHFFIQNQNVLARALGREQYEKAVASSGYQSAYEWCERYAEHGKANGFDVFRIYLSRISTRGWGRFMLERLDENGGVAEIALEHSIFAEHARKDETQGSCNFFASWIAGSMDWAAESLSKTWRIQCREHQCVMKGAKRCLFHARPL